MSVEVTITSAHDGTTLRLFDLDAFYFAAALRGPNVQAIARVYVYEPGDLAAFFRELAEQWRGWEGKKEWRSLEGELSLAATVDSTGHVSLLVNLRSCTGPFDWEVRAALPVEAGQLDGISSQVELFVAGYEA